MVFTIACEFLSQSQEVLSNTLLWCCLKTMVFKVVLTYESKDNNHSNESTSCGAIYFTIYLQNIVWSFIISVLKSFGRVDEERLIELKRKDLNL